MNSSGILGSPRRPGSRGALALPISSLLVFALGVGGCGLLGRQGGASVEAVKTKEETSERPELTVGELDQLTRNYSDRLVARVSSACDAIKREASDEELRSRADQLKLTVALAAYDIVTRSDSSLHVPGAEQHLVDLAILTELEAIRWVDEKGAKRIFGPDGQERLGEAFSQSRQDIWHLASRVMRTGQIDQLRTLILRWRRANPRVEWLSLVRFDVIAQGKEGEGFAQSLGTLFNPISPAVGAVDEVRITAEQGLFFIKRLPLLLDWTASGTGRNVSGSAKEVVDHAAWRAVEILILVAVLALLYPVVLAALHRRQTRTVGNAK